MDPRSLIFHDIFTNDPETSQLLEASLRKNNYTIEDYQPVDDVLLSVIQEQQESIDKIESQPKDKIVDVKIKKIRDELNSIQTAKSTGVSLLKRTLRKLVESSSEDPLAKYNQQEWFEEECTRLAFEKRADSEQNMPECAKILQSLGNKETMKWLDDLTMEIEKEISDASKNLKSASDIKLYVPFLKLIPAKQLALITLGEFLRVPKVKEMQDSGFVGDFIAVDILMSIGKMVELESNARFLKKKKSARLVHYFLI